jgi:hypothetical protein
MNKLARLAVLVFLAGCGSKGTSRSLLPVDITAAADVGTIAQVVVFVNQDEPRGGGQPFPWNPPAGQPLKVGIYLPDYVMGAVKVEADALDVNGQVIGHAGPAPGVVTPGQTSPVVSLNLVKVSATLPDGGVAPDGGGVTLDTAPLPDGAVPPDAAKPDDGPPVEAGPPDVATGLTWSAAENLENDSISRSYYTRVAIDSAGNALVAWAEATSVRTRRYDAASKSWGTIKTIESGGEIYSLSLGLGNNGHATMAWNHYVDSAKPLEAGPRVTHSKDGGNIWSPPKLLHNGRMYGGGVLAVSRDGHARLAWEENDAATDLNSLWSAYYDDSTGVWGAPAMVKLGTGRYERHPKIVMNAQGGGLLVWIQPEADVDSTFGTSFAVNQPPKAAQLLDNYTANDTQGPAVAITPDGSKGIAMWVQRNNGPYDLFTAEYTADAGWKAPARFMTSASWVSDPALTIDQTGTVTAIWDQPIASGKSNLVSARRPAGQPWSPLFAIETTNLANQDTREDPVPVAAVDSAGNVQVAWARKLNADEKEWSFSIMTRRFAGGMWQPEQTLAMKMGLRATDPELAVAEDGRAAIAFYYFHPDGTTDPDAYNAFGILFK